MAKPNRTSNSETLAATSYESKVAEIEKIIAQIESGKLELAEVFTQFSNAVEYLHHCETFLQQRQQQVDLLVETLTDEGIRE